MRIVLVVLAVLLVFTGFVQAQGEDDLRELEVPDSTKSYWNRTDFSRALVDSSEIISGGVARDGIPPYYPEGYTYPDDLPGSGGSSPRFTVRYTDIASTDTYLPDQQPVVAVEIGGEARAYPLILLNNHEIVNTELAGVPLAVTFCPLCNAAIVYDRRVGDETLHFGVSGMLRNSDLIMWDHETQSWWQQFTGQGIVGTYAGTQLTLLPSLVVSWADFKAQHPDGQVLANPNSGNPLERGVSYAGYDASGNTFLFFGEHDDRLFPTTRVLGYFGATGAIAYPFETLAEVGVVNDQINGGAVVVLWQTGAVSLFTNSIETGSAGLFSAVLADGTALTFVQVDGVISDEQTGSQWNVFGRAVAGELAGTQLDPLFAHPHFWFAWRAFRPDTLIWEPGMVADAAWGR